MMTKHATITLPSDTEILIVRQFDAPRELLFEAMTTPEHMKNWYGPAQHELVGCEIDLRIGGSYRYVTGLEQGGEIAFSGEFIEVDPPGRLVYTEVFEAVPGATSTVATTLDEQDGRTMLTVLAGYPAKSDRDAVLESGMESGMQESYDRLEALVATLG